MVNSKDGAAVRSEIETAKVAAAENLPKLLALRQQLELEAGRIGVASRNATRYMYGCAIGAGLAFVYALIETMNGTPPLVSWGIAAVLAACAAYLHHTAKVSAGERARALEELHTRMLSVGRQIDRAERLLRH